MNIDAPRLLQSLRISYQAKGNRLWSRCPSRDHDDQDPSWFMWHAPGKPENGRHRCFGCGFRGGPADLVGELFNIDYAEAREWLEDGGLDLPLLDVKLEIRATRRAPVELPDGVVLDQPLVEWPTVFRRELERKRLLDDRMVQRWGLGYALRGRLRGRIVIPVRSVDGKLLAYQARTVIGAEQRYLNPSGARPYVFGQQLWPSPGKRGTVVVVEGPFDALAVDQVTSLPVGALLGSEVHPSQLLALGTFERVVIMTDPDKAGEKAVEQLAPLRRHTTLERVTLPAGDDPDSLRPRARLRELLPFRGEPEHVHRVGVAT